MGTEPVEAGAIKTKNPRIDNLKKTSIAKTQAIKINDWDKFDLIQNTLREKDIKLSDIVDIDILKQLGDEDNDLDEKEVNELIEDVWTDFSKNQF